MMIRESVQLQIVSAMMNKNVRNRENAQLSNIEDYGEKTH